MTELERKNEADAEAWAMAWVLVLGLSADWADHVVWTLAACLYLVWLLVRLLIDVKRIEAEIKALKEQDNG